MNHYSFIAASPVDLMSLNDVRHVENISEPVQLSSLGELSLLISTLNSGLTIPPTVNMEDVKEIWTITGPLNHLSDDEFEDFYTQWLRESNRQNTEAERAQLERLNAFIPEINNARYCLIALQPGKLNS